MRGRSLNGEHLCRGVMITVIIHSHLPLQAHMPELRTECRLDGEKLVWKATAILLVWQFNDISNGSSMRAVPISVVLTTFTRGIWSRSVVAL